jgi:hypothetical protein
VAAYSAQWAQFRRWNRSGVVALIAMASFFVSILGLSLSAPNSMLLLLTMGGVALSWFSFLYFVVRQDFFRCPRCGGRYFQRTLWARRIPFRRSCVHCALRLYDAA